MAIPEIFAQTQGFGYWQLIHWVKQNTTSFNILFSPTTSYNVGKQKTPLCNMHLEDKPTVGKPNVKSKQQR